MSRLDSLRNLFIYKFLAQKHIVGFPKSGNTWIKFFLANYISLYYRVPLDFDFDKRLRKPHKDAPKILFTHIGGISGHQAAHIAQNDIREILETIIPEFYGKDVVFLTRDPRDVVVSLYFHLHKHNSSVSLSDFIRDSKSGLQAIVYYMNEWLSHEEKFTSFAVFSYEERILDSTQEFRRLLDVLNMPIDEDFLKKAVHEASFDNMRNIQKTKSIKHKTFLAEKPNDPESAKIRKGKVGGYTDYFSEEDMAYAKEVLTGLDRCFGYS